MASDDQSNPYERPSAWPRLRQGPMTLGPLPKAAPRPAVPPAQAAAVARPTSILTGSATPMPLANQPAPIDALARRPQPAPAPPERQPEPLAGDLTIPAPSASGLDGRAVPAAARRARRSARQRAWVAPVVAASAVGIAGVGILAFVMTAGQRAAGPAPALAPASTIVSTPAVAVENPVTATVPPLETPKSAPDHRAAPRRVATAPASRTTAPHLSLPDVASRYVAPPPAAAPQLIVPPAEPAPSQSAPVVRAPPPGPDEPIATHAPE